MFRLIRVILVVALLARGARPVESVSPNQSPPSDAAARTTDWSAALPVPSDFDALGLGADQRRGTSSAVNAPLEARLVRESYAAASPNAEDLEETAAATGLDGDHLRAALTAAGLVRVYAAHYRLAGAGPVPFVDVLIYETGDAAAAAGVALVLGETAENPDAKTENLPASLGDGATAVRYAQGGTVLHAIVPTGELLAEVRLKGDAEGPPATAEVATIAARLLERIGTVRAGAAPGLGRLTLRLDDTLPGVSVRKAYYEELAGESVLDQDANAASVARTSAELYFAPTDLYNLIERYDPDGVGSGLGRGYANMLLDWGDPASASAFVAGTADRLGGMGGFALQSAPALGDEAAAYGYDGRDGTVVRGIVVRVGRVVAHVAVEGELDAAGAAVFALATAQVACLVVGTPCAAVHVPEALLADEALS